METMKKEWGKPLTGIQEFAPQEFIAACAPDKFERVYKFWCNFDAGSYVWLETNGQAGLQTSGNWVNNWETDLRFDRTWASTRARWGNFHACNAYHEVRVECDAAGNIIDGTNIKSIFPDGWINTRARAAGAQQCVVWTDNWTNTHVTQHLDVDDFHIANPS